MSLGRSFFRTTGWAAAGAIFLAAGIAFALDMGLDLFVQRFEMLINTFCESLTFCLQPAA